jgi:phosphoglycolate phosphatase
MTAIRLAVFDCDGTLVDSQANICRAATAAFVANALPAPPPEAVRRIVGLSLIEAMRMLAPALGDAAHRRLAQDYKDAFLALHSAGGLDPEPLFDGIVHVLDTLLARGWVLGVATGKSDRGLARVLADHGIADRFVTLQTADRHPSKPDPAMLAAALAETGAEPHMAAMIGDTSFDMAMARAAGCRAIGVAWGYHDAQDLAQGGAELIADAPGDLVGLLQ